MARCGRAMSRHEAGSRDSTKRILATIKKRTRGNSTQKPSNMLFALEVFTSFLPFSGLLLACSAQSEGWVLRRDVLTSDRSFPNYRGSGFSFRTNSSFVTEVGIWGKFWWLGSLPSPLEGGPGAVTGHMS